MILPSVVETASSSAPNRRIGGKMSRAVVQKLSHDEDIYGSGSINGVNGIDGEL
jgi:hypothetical protein